MVTLLLLFVAYPGSFLLFHPEALTGFPRLEHLFNWGHLLFSIISLTAILTYCDTSLKKLIWGAFAFFLQLFLLWGKSLFFTAFGAVVLIAYLKLMLAFFILSLRPRFWIVATTAFLFISNQTVFRHSGWERWVDETVTGFLAKNSNPSISLSKKIGLEAQSLRNFPYPWGANLTDSGKVDCSSFTRRIYHTIGFNLPRLAEEQFTDERGKKIETKNDLKEGDLIFFDGFRGPGRVARVGIYIGENHFVAADAAKGVVTLDSLTSALWSKKYMGGRRFIK